MNSSMFSFNSSYVGWVILIKEVYYILAIYIRIESQYEGEQRDHGQEYSGLHGENSH